METDSRTGSPPSESRCDWSSDVAIIEGDRGRLGKGLSRLQLPSSDSATADRRREGSVSQRSGKLETKLRPSGRECDNIEVEGTSIGVRGLLVHLRSVQWPVVETIAISSSRMIVFA